MEFSRPKNWNPIFVGWAWRDRSRDLKLVASSHKAERINGAGGRRFTNINLTNLITSFTRLLGLSKDLEEPWEFQYEK